MVFIENAWWVSVTNFLYSYIKGELVVQVVNIRQLKTNPSVALRDAKNELMMVTNRDKPDALLVSMEQLAGIPNLEQVRLVLGIA